MCVVSRVTSRVVLQLESREKGGTGRGESGEPWLEEQAELCWVSGRVSERGGCGLVPWEVNLVLGG